ncbi:MAG: TfoX/Sxy family protein [Thermoleophilia bacterium]|nr:TfoX/Sxy family protein [Thermoleophilia bacterium]
MAYDEGLAERVREVVAAETGLSERKMFGGLAFMLDGHMCCGIVAGDLMLRLGAERADEALGRPHVRPMDFTGRPMRGMVYAAPEGLRGAALRRWLEQAIAHARSLPPKQPKRRR